MSHMQNIENPVYNQSMGTAFKQDAGDLRSNLVREEITTTTIAPDTQKDIFQLKETGYRAPQPSTGLIGEHPPQHLHKHNDFISHTHEPTVVENKDTYGLRSNEARADFRADEFRNTEGWNKDMLHKGNFNKDFDNINLNEKKGEKVVGFVEGEFKETIYQDGQKVGGHTEVICEPIMEKQSFGDKVKTAYSTTLDRSNELIHEVAEGTKHILTHAKEMIAP